MATQKDVDDLHRAVEERKKFFAEVIPVIVDLLRTKGVKTLREQGRFHTNVMRSLENFGGFNFGLDEGRSEMGGSQLGISHNGEPYLRLTSEGATFTAEKFLESGKVEYCTPGAEGSRASDEMLLEVVRNRDQYLEKMEAEVRQWEEQRLQDAAIDNQYSELKEEASRLGVMLR